MRRPFPPSILTAAGFAVLGLGALLGMGGAHAQPARDSWPAPRLAWPVACSVGRTCWVQNYVDRDPSKVARDYTCGTLTYDAHNGTDIRVPDMAAERAGVDVLAAADGRVLRVRDGVTDVSVRTTGLEAVKGTECGNGLVIDHGQGWESQYCHLAKGSLRVKPGETVKAGQPLGRIGLSGETEFPHLHFSLRHRGAEVDPFAPAQGAGPACGSGISLWRAAPPYVARSVINADFSSRPVDMAAIEAGDIRRPDLQAAYLVAYVRAIGLKAGDEQSLTVSAPDGRTLAAAPASRLSANQAQRFLLVGKRLPPGGWPKGAYRASYVVRAGGQVVLRRDFATTL